MSAGRTAVVGAGIVGCLVAHEVLRRTPDAQVMLIDRDAVGSGASRRSAGLHFPRGASDRVRRMSAYSEDFYARLAGADADVPIHFVDMTVVASAARAAEVHEAYLPSAKLTAATAPDDGRLRIPDGSLAWDGQGCQYADVPRLAQHLAGRLPRAVRRLEGVAVTAVEPAADAVVLRLSTGDDVVADRVVLAPGPWVADPAWGDLLAPAGIRVKKVVALHVDEPAGPRDRCVVLHDEDAFLMPMAHRGHWLFSYTCQEWDVHPDSLEPALQAHHLAQARAILARYAPALAARCTSGRVFCDAYTPDRQPFVHALEPTGRVVFAGGANGSGYRLAPAIAAEAVDQFDRRGKS